MTGIVNVIIVIFIFVIFISDFVAGFKFGDRVQYLLVIS